MALILSGTDGLSDVDGTAATPAIRGTDTNTGIFFPAADTIAFAEGGVESMRLNSSGVLVTTNDASISGLTFGKGGGAVASNTAVGVNALAAATSSGDGSVAVGTNALYLNTNGYNNTTIGAYSLDANTTGNSNSGLGYAALSANTTGSSNTAIGSLALFSNTTASNNTAVGYQAAYTNTTGTNLTAIGYQAGYTNNAANNTFVGRQAGQSTSSGANNTALGSTALANNSTGGDNTAIGMFSLVLNTTGANNTSVGKDALYSNTTASNCTAVGYQAGYSISTSGSTPESTAVGSQALYTGGGGADVAVGYRALYSENTSGGASVAVGTRALESATSGYYNVAVGQTAGLNITTGFNNVCLGRVAGTDAVFNVITESNRIVMGNNTHTNAYIKIAWTVTSDARDKTNIAEIPHGLNFVQQLQPKQYHFKVSREDETPTGNIRYGFLAQDILALEGDNPVIIDNEQPENLKYNGESLVPVLVKAIQELNAKVEAQALEIAQLKGN